MQYIEFFYHNAIVTVQTQDALSYFKNDEPQGILVDMWKLIILIMNNKDVLFIDSKFKFEQELDVQDKHELILNFYQIYDYSVSQSFIENQFDYNRKIYDLSPIIVSENYLFVFLDNFWPVALKILIQIFIYITYMIVPWIVINLNFIAFFLLDNSQNKPYYQKLKESFVWFGGQPKQEKTNICKQIYRLVFAIMSVFIAVILFSDFTYLIINSLAKSNFNTIQDMKDNNAIACYNYQDKFLDNLFGRDRGLQKIVGQSSLQCMQMLDDHTVDVVIMGEFTLLIFLEENQSYLSKLRYQIKLNTNIAHHILINKNEPEWFQNELKQAIDQIQKLKLDLQIKEKHLPTKLYNSKNKSIMPYQPTLQFICASISIFFIIIIQITEIVNEFKIFKSLKKNHHQYWRIIRKSKKA